MYKYYKYTGNKVIVTDDKGNIDSFEYTDSFIEKLVSENLMEEINKRINKYESIIEDDEYYLEKNKLNPILFIPTHTTFGYAGPYFINMFLGLDLENKLIDIKVGTTDKLHFYAIFLAITGLVIGSIKTYKQIIENKDYKRKIEGSAFLIEELKIKLNKEKSIYESLINDKNIDNKNEYEEDMYKKIEIDDSYAMNRLMFFCNAAFDYGTNKETYISYYKKGILDIKLKELKKTKKDLIKEFIINDLDKIEIEKQKVLKNENFN